jgi:hypothetical protein
MKWFKLIQHVWIRFRYPVSMPEDIALALGIQLSNTMPFKDLVTQLSRACCPKRLTKFMPRSAAEEAFSNAIRTERFCEKTLISYYFSEGWLEFVLLFDRSSRLRRIYLLHRAIQTDEGIELPLAKAS